MELSQSFVLVISFSLFSLWKSEKPTEYYLVSATCHIVLPSKTGLVTPAHFHKEHFKVSFNICKERNLYKYTSKPHIYVHLLKKMDSNSFIQDIFAC